MAGLPSLPGISSRGFLLFSTIIAAIFVWGVVIEALSHPTSIDTDSAMASEAPLDDLAKLERMNQAIERALEDGSISKVDLRNNEVWIDETVWNGLTLQDREYFARACCEYVGRKGVQGLYAVSILGDNNGEELGLYAKGLGFKNKTTE